MTMRTVLNVKFAAIVAMTIALCTGCGEKEKGLEFMYFDFTDSQTDISKDGRIAFVHEHDGIYIIEENRLYRWHNGGEWPSWSHDGTKIAFMSAGDIWHRAIDADSAIRLTIDGSNSHPKWLHGDGAMVYMKLDSTGGSIWRCDVETMESARLIDQVNDFAVGENAIYYMDNGKVIRYELLTGKKEMIADVGSIETNWNRMCVVGNTLRYVDASDVWSIDLATYKKDKCMRISNPPHCNFMAWSTDGSFVVYTYSRVVYPDAELNAGTLWRMDVASRKKTQLTVHVNGKLQLIQ